MVARRFDVFLVSLDPRPGADLGKTRPCVVVSPDEMNRSIGTVIVAPLTTRERAYPTRIPCRLKRKAGEVVLEQIRAVDTRQLVLRLGQLPGEVQSRVLEVLAEIFAP